MKTILKNILTSATVVLLTLVLTSCNEKLSVNEPNQQPPIIESFSPATATVNSQITIIGKNLQHTTKVTLGGDSVEIKQRISSTKIIVLASSWAHSGKIKVFNTLGNSESAETFAYTYASPQMGASDVPQSVDFGGKIMITGKDMNVATNVWFKDSNNHSTKAIILSRTADEIVLIVPYVATDNAKVILEYFDGQNYVNTPDQGAPTTAVVKKTPKVTNGSYPKTNVGQSITITGVNLDKVDSLTISGFKCQLRDVSSTSLTFTIPGGDFVDGDNTGKQIVMHFFAGNETTILSSDFNAYVPKVMFWEQATINAQDRNMNAFNSFFSPQTGIVYANGDWGTVVDPISRQYTSATCSAANIPAVTEAEYNSVNPYFFISGANAGTLALNSPAGSQGQLKNFFFSPASSDRVTVNGNCYGTAVVMWRMLQTNVPAENAIIEAVKNQTITEINKTTYPIDPAAKTIGGVDVSTLASASTNKEWAPNLFPDAEDKAGIKPDAVLMCVYMNYKGYDKENPTSNVKRIGFIHITNVDMARVSAASPSKSFMTFNMYWQKYDNAQ